ncbi:MAG: hypothetical protein JXE06_04015 [Coriobacteriia bacterium]|nr:hypothetical protein [Coriobacteriia bacterium]MBN2822654.1 hypothetical protein [Coriobacteriia bacterium]
MPQSPDRDRLDIETEDVIDPVVETGPPVAMTRTHRGIFADPVVRRLAWVGAIMLLAFLATVVSALAFGVINPPAPRTAVEQELALAEAEIEAGEADAEDWYEYIGALITSEQYSKAERMIQSARDGGYEDPAKQYLLLVKVRLDLARGDYELALEDSQTAMDALEAQLDIELKLYEQTKQPTTMIADGLGANYDTLHLNRAEAFEVLGRVDEAILELDEYLAGSERAADILVWRGDLKAESGDIAGARADYTSAAVYMPGDSSIAEKLEGLGAE